MTRKAILSAAVCALWASQVFGGEVLFKNGDRLTGKVKSSADGKLVIESKIAGTITVPMSEVKTFTTDEPVEIRLKSGEIVNQKVTAGTTDGTVQTAGPVTGAAATGAAGAPGPETVTLAQVATINPGFGTWHGDIKAGLVVTSGNSRSQTANVIADANRRGEKDRITLKAEYLFARDTNVETGQTNTTTDSWDALGKYDYFLTKKVYLYGLMSAEHDRIADLNIRLAPSAGIGYQWHEGPVWNFNTEAGLGFTYEDYAHDGEREYMSARAAYHYDRKLIDKLKFFNDLEYRPDVSDLGRYTLDGDIGLHTDFNKSLFAEFKLEWKYNSDPAPGREKNDLRYILSAGYQF
jgi:putative salt-induced outer membrane protein YdiY